MKVTVGAVVKGKTSLAYKTGNWRSERPVLRVELCKRCGVCADVCPDSAIHAVTDPGQDKPEYVIDHDYCKGCGMCIYECPTDAIENVPEEK
jgi:pyruvate ferredoxin oxidoreductase delta subunit